MKKRILTAVCMAAMMLTACGHDSEDEGFSAPEKTPTAPAETTEADDEKDDNYPWHDDFEYDPYAGLEDKEQSPFDQYNYSCDESCYEEEEDSDAMQRIDEMRFMLRADDAGFKIRDGVLYDYEGISPEVHIPDGVKRIESHAFWSVSSVEAVDIPGSVESIGCGAFWSCSGLKLVHADEGLKRISSSAFWSCSGLEDVELPASVEHICSDVFWAIDGITIHAPKGSYAEGFAEYRGFDFTPEGAVYEPVDRTNVIRASQYQYGDFTEFVIPPNITGIEAEAFQYCDKLESIIIPANVSFIGSNAFEYCDSLKTVNIVSCKDIKAEAFEYCESLVSVRIGEGCETIGSEAFSYCRALKEVYLPASVTSINKRAFEYTDADLILHVPKGSYAEDFAMAMNIPFDNKT